MELDNLQHRHQRIGNIQTIKTPTKTSTTITNNTNHLVLHVEKPAIWLEIAGIIRMYDPYVVVVVMVAAVGTLHHAAVGNEVLDPYAIQLIPAV